jgi:competence protein ComEC
MAAGWRFWALGGASAGLALSATVPGHREPGRLLVVAVAALALAQIQPPGRRIAIARALLIGVAGLAVALAVGDARLRAIDAAAYAGPVGERLSLRAQVASVPRRSEGEVRVQLEADRGKLLAWAQEPVPELPIGAEVSAEGVLRRPPSWYAATLRRQGIAMILRPARIVPTGGRRGGLAGRLDAIRDRAEEALGTGIPAREASLARGFVLGQDDRIDPQTVDDFRRSGLSHLLAVSGQNVLLLALLASPVLAALGLPLRARLLWLLALIGVYVPLAGAGPSIQRAGVMGAAGVVATLAGRPASRAYALLLAATVTLALNPRSCADAGWQLSFAAVVGIFLLAAPLRDALVARLGSGPLRRGLAEGTALTVAATLATAPLISHHFGALPLGTLFANLLAMPAVALAMWLGMISAAVGQVPAVPLQPLNWLNALLLAYIAQVAAWFGRPGWAVTELELRTPLAVIGAYTAIAAVTAAALSIEASRRGARERLRRVRRRPATRARTVLAAAAAVALLAPAADAILRDRRAAPGPAGLRVEVLDVGQGDAILLQPAHGDPVLVDGGPPGGDLESKLRAAGVSQLAAVIVTHDQTDHAGGVREILGELPVRRLVFSFGRRSLLAAARGSGTIPYRVGEGSEIASGGLRLEVLWPPRDRSQVNGVADPNQRSIVLLARWESFSMLLTGDAEAEAVPLDPGPVDVLKVSHHGSDDAGLGPLLDRLSPQLALISVGAGNPFGHPTAGTLATLAAHRVPVLRTDRDGTVTLEVGRSGYHVDAGE